MRASDYIAKHRGILSCALEVSATEFDECCEKMIHESEKPGHPSATVNALLRLASQFETQAKQARSALSDLELLD